MPLPLPRVSNEDFLRAVFGDGEWRDAHVCGFAEDPSDLDALGKRGYWAGGKWDRLGARITGAFGGQNAYYTISLFGDDPADASGGVGRRRKSLFRSCHVIVVDDVGTKVMDTSRLVPDPSYVLETSPGNFQWGYILDTPETDGGRVNALLDGMVALGLCPDGKDPGMKGVTRYVRLPEGRNTKGKYQVDGSASGAGFACVLREWRPGARFALDDLARPWGIALPAPGAVPLVGGARGPGGAAALAAAGLGAGDPVLGWLDAWGMVPGGTAADGVGVLITCPWTDEHTGRADSGAAYWPGVGGFKCHHGHCEARGRADLVAWVDERLERDSAGLVSLSQAGFTRVPGYVPPDHARFPAPVFTPAPSAPVAAGASAGVAASMPKAAGSASGVSDEAAFFAELIYVSAEDKFYSLRSGELLTQRAVDVSWGARLEGAGALPGLGTRGGEVMPPSRWFVDVTNIRRARRADAMTYWPGVGVFVRDTEGVEFVNTWRPGFGGLGRVGAGLVRDTDVALWLDLVRHIVGGAEGPEAVEWVLDWMALVVGEPGLKPGFHLLLQGGQGLGKDTILAPVRWGVGDRNVGTCNAAALGGSFNAWAEKRLVIVNELVQTTRGASTGADQYNTLKELTENTSPTVRINQKNRREYYARNVSAFAITSNAENAAALDADDRRFLVVMAGEGRVVPWDADRVARVAVWLKEGGGNALCAEWLADRWDALGAARRGALCGRAPGTAGKALMVRAAEGAVQAWTRYQIEAGTWPDLMTAEDVCDAWARAAKYGGCGFGQAPGLRSVSKILRPLGGGAVYGGSPVRLLDGSQKRLYATRRKSLFEHMSEKILADNYAKPSKEVFKTPGDYKKEIRLLIDNGSVDLSETPDKPKKDV